MLNGSDRKALVRAAFRLALSRLSDEEAAQQLRQEVQKHRRGRQAALRVLAGGRSEFDSDRAYRLLRAVVKKTPVDPSPTTMRDLFASEEALGRLPLEDAFSRLEQLEPALSRLRPNEDRAIPEISQNSDAAKISVSTLLGPLAHHTNPLIRSQLALSVASQYLAILGGDLQFGDVRTPYFSAPRRMVVRSTAIWGGP